MRKLTCLCCIIFLFFGSILHAQELVKRSNIITGKVYTINDKGKKEGLPSANLIWKGQDKGAVTSSDGSFILERNPNTSIVIVGYTGYTSDTIDVANVDKIDVNLKVGIELKGAEIIGRGKATTIGHFDLIRAETMGGHELVKAACCNLSESFETNPSVDVSTTDAITGTKQIQMLGLAGPYSQLTRENMPDIRGLSSINGMEFIPGTWIESIQLIEGAGSVVNGYESMAGQINTELKKPTTMEKFFVNAYVNSDRSMELNTHIKIPLGEKWVGGLFLHGKYNNMRHDSNKDNFMDMPLSKSFIALNRYEWLNPYGIHFEVGVRYAFLNQIGGTMDFDENKTIDSTTPWGMINKIRKVDVWTKIGTVSSKKSWQSTAIQLSGGVYNQESRYGMNTYFGKQQSFYANFINQGRIASKEKHEYKLGASFMYDNFDEKLNSKIYTRKEIVPGVFGEYTYKPSTKLGVVAGMRADFHNQYGVFYSPRLHLRYELLPKTVLRLSVGHGQRTANVISEHLSVLSTSRQLTINSDNSNYGYGLNPEKAWNYGINLTQSFELDYRDGSISASFYRTNFENQIVYDLEQGPREAHIYNLQGNSFANSLQFKLDYELFKRFDLRLAYRYYDVQTTYGNELKRVPMLAPHRGFINLAYSTRSKWSFDFTLNIQGEKRIPSIEDAGQPYQRPTKSPVYALMNAQITKQWHEKLDIYIGGENIGNYKQKDPIISAENPYGPYFDTSLIWGPLYGIKIYAGVRYKII